MSFVYEMRTYSVAPGKMDALIARFADRTEPLFRRHGIRTIGYWIPRENPKNLLMYIVEHDSLDVAEKNWEAFRDDKDWHTVKAETEANGPLVASIDRCFMDKIDFAARKSGVSSKA